MKTSILVGQLGKCFLLGVKALISLVAHCNEISHAHWDAEKLPFRFGLQR
jgi:hypothetical protein